MATFTLDVINDGGSLEFEDDSALDLTHSRAMLEGSAETQPFFTLLKLVATWVTTWAGVPGGLFAPALAIGGSLGNDIAQFTHYANAPTLIALGMAGVLAAVTQACPPNLSPKKKEPRRAPNSYAFLFAEEECRLNYI